MRPELQLVCRFGADWTLDHAPADAAWAPFHIVTRGACVLRVGEARYRLNAGDVVVLPHGAPHIMQSLTSGNGAPMRIDRRLDNGIAVRTNLPERQATEAAETQLICGRMRFEHVRNNMVIAALPAVVIVASDGGDDAARMHILVDCMNGELQADRPGAGTIAINLASALMMIVLRVHFESTKAVSGIISLLSHPITGRAIAAMFSELGRSWTLDELAAVSQTSRATLVRMFRQASDTAPLAFLTKLRLDLARRRLESETTPLAVIAVEAGYQSQSAFHRGFQRRYGMPPGAIRRGRDRQN